MPVYEFRCIKCGKEFELVETVRQHERHRHPKCPECKSTEVERLYSRVFAVTSKKS